jgi:hypothetical protein
MSKRVWRPHKYGEPVDSSDGLTRVLRVNALSVVWPPNHPDRVFQTVVGGRRASVMVGVLAGLNSRSLQRLSARANKHPLVTKLTSNKSSYSGARVASDNWQLSSVPLRKAGACAGARLGEPYVREQFWYHARACP